MPAAPLSPILSADSKPLFYLSLPMTIFFIVSNLLHFAITPIADRQRYTLKTLPFLLLALLPLILAAHVRLRHPNAPLFVKVLVVLVGLPIMMHFYSKRYFAVVWFESDGVPSTLNSLNQIIGLAIGISALKMIEVLFMCDDTEFQIKDSLLHSSRKGSSDASSVNLSRPFTFPGTCTPLEIDFVLNLRGSGYNWGPKNSKAGYKALFEAEQLEKRSPAEANHVKWSHILRVGKALLVVCILNDVCLSIIREPNIFPPAGRLGGGPVREAADGRLGLAGPPLITLLSGLIIFSGMQSHHLAVYLVMLLFTRPSKIPITVARWEPFPFQQPYLATSLESFWSRHWHSFLRRPLIVFAYNPLQRFSSRLGLKREIGKGAGLVASFALSGLIHEICLECLANQYYDDSLRSRDGHTYLGNESKIVQSQYGFGARNFLTTYAFTIQAVFIILEKIWLSQVESTFARWVPWRVINNDKVIVGGMTRSFLGWTWSLCCLMYSGSLFADLCFTHGLINALLSPRLTGKLFLQTRRALSILLDYMTFSTA